MCLNGCRFRRINDCWSEKKANSLSFFFLIEVRKVVVYIEYNLVFRYIIQNTRKQEINVNNFVNF